jgi:hypothetical protein
MLSKPNQFVGAKKKGSNRRILLDWLQFFIMGLATWRIASLISNEQGPFYIFERIRERAGECYLPDGTRIATAMLGKLLQCLDCVSVHIGIFWFVVYFFVPNLWIMSIPFALSAMAIIWEKVVE